jgi:hypothetical protein
LLFPAFFRARETARRISCASNMRQIGMAFSQYTTEKRRAHANAQLAAVVWKVLDLF